MNKNIAIIGLGGNLFDIYEALKVKKYSLSADKILKLKNKVILKTILANIC